MTSWDSRSKARSTGADRDTGRVGVASAPSMEASMEPEEEEEASKKPEEEEAPSKPHKRGTHRRGSKRLKKASINGVSSIGDAWLLLHDRRRSVEG